jgi:hypothetical protein
MKPIKRRKCKNCHSFFLPDPRNAGRQKFCGKPECRKASKRESQRKWLNKPENRDHFRGQDNVERVQQWRAAHPGYWRRKRSEETLALQDPLIVQPIENNKDRHRLTSIPLQDLLTVQPFVLLGLIANLTGTALQDDIDVAIRRLQQLGQDIADNHIQFNQGGPYGIKTPYPASPDSSRPQAVQLAGPPVGP